MGEYVSNHRSQVLSALIHVLELDLARVWKLQLPEEALINLYARTATELLEKPANVKSKSVKRCVFIMCSVLIQKYKQVKAHHFSSCCYRCCVILLCVLARALLVWRLCKSFYIITF